jgi:hypothetical protein
VLALCTAALSTALGLLAAIIRFGQVLSGGVKG